MFDKWFSNIYPSQCGGDIVFILYTLGESASHFLIDCFRLRNEILILPEAKCERRALSSCHCRTTEFKKENCWLLLTVEGKILNLHHHNFLILLKIHLNETDFFFHCSPFVRRIKSVYFMFCSAAEANECKKTELFDHEFCLVVVSFISSWRDSKKLHKKLLLLFVVQFIENIKKRSREICEKKIVNTQQKQLTHEEGKFEWLNCPAFSVFIILVANCTIFFSFHFYFMPFLFTIAFVDDESTQLCGKLENLNESIH